MSENGPATIPVYQDYMNPILEVLRSSGGLPIELLDTKVFELMGLPSAVTAIPHDPARPDLSEVEYRCGWARTYLKKAGLITNAIRGVWSATDEGRVAGRIDPHALASTVAATYRTTGGDGPADTDASDPGTDGDAPTAANEEPDGLEEELVAARVGADLGRDLREARDRLAAEGEILDATRTSQCLRLFRERFGPDVLASLDGEALLDTMHRRDGAKDSLVYWLEFKDDEEFPARFGGIGGGSALKFGIYQSAEHGHWMTGSSVKQERLHVGAAVERARRQRDQLVEGARVLQTVAPTLLAADYEHLQRRMREVAPDLAETSWGHKYFALLFPDLLEPFHGEGTQRHHLFKLVKMPRPGRYVNARLFVGVARQLEMSLLELATVLHRRNGTMHDYWRVGTTGDGQSEWKRMLDGGFASVGYPAVADISEAARDEVRRRMQASYPGLPHVVSRIANQVFNFAHKAQERDILVAMEGQRVRGVGRITGPYRYDADPGPFPHRRPVEWLLAGDWRLPETEGLLTTFTPLKKSPRNIVEIEARLLGRGGALKSAIGVNVVPKSATTPPAPPDLTDIPARVRDVLQRKRQVILYGPPGTGKTYWAERAARELAARSWFSTSWEQLDGVKMRALEQGGAIELCAFHAAYGYEDFLEGYRPTVTGSNLAFERRDGVFKRLCDRARTTPARGYYLIIDEVNRGDIPRIFGELLTVLEKDKRGKEVTLPVSGTKFSVPDNVYVIGTMNTADRSIALLDAALRRRFGFIELLPNSAMLARVAVGGLPLGPWLDELNRRIVQHAGRDARSLQVGHSYLMAGGAPVREFSRFAEILRDDIIPLLQEYCYEDFGKLEGILGDKIVLRSKHRVDESLLEPPRHDDLLQALLSAFPAITATTQAVEADEDEAVDATGGDDDGSAT